MVLYQGERGSVSAKITNKETQEVVIASVLESAVIKALLMDSNRRTACIWLSSKNDFSIDHINDSFSWIISEEQTARMLPGFYTLEISVNTPETGAMIGVRKRVLQIEETNISNIPSERK